MARATCERCGKKFDYDDYYSNSGEANGCGYWEGYGYFCCEGHYLEFKKMKDADNRRKADAYLAQKLDEELERIKMEKQVIELDPKKLGLPLDEAWGNTGDWNGVEIQDKKSWKVSDGKLTIKIGRIQNDAKGPTGTLRITFEWIHSDGSREICAKFYRNKLEAGYGYPDIEATVDYTKPKNKTRESKAAICVYELDGDGKWVRLTSYEFKSEAQKERDAEQAKRDEEQAKRDAAARKKREAEEAVKRAAREKESKRLDKVEKAFIIFLSVVPLWLAALCVLSGNIPTVYIAAIIIAATVWGIFHLGGPLLSDTDLLSAIYETGIGGIAIDWIPMVVISLLCTGGNYIAVGAIVVGAIVLALAMWFLKLPAVAIVAAILSIALPVAAIGLGVATMVRGDKIEDKVEAVAYSLFDLFDTKAAKQMKKWYTPEADAVVGQKFARYRVDVHSGAISTEYEVKFGKNGRLLIGVGDFYTVDTATRTINTWYKKDKEEAPYARYFPDGSAYYSLNKDGTASKGYPKEGAAFNAAQATEVIGKTFSGKWSDKFTATVTFGKDGRASVLFSDGDKASGAYIASDEDNVVLYNHKDAGVWHMFVYSDDDSGVRFKRMCARQKENGNFSSEPRADIQDDWKRK